MSTNERTLRVLIVDDNQDAADTLGMLVEELGHQAHVTYGGAQALDVASAFQADLMLIDLAMPGMDGCLLVGRFRQMPAFAQTRIVAITGHTDLGHKTIALKAGFDAVLFKPIALADVVAALAGVATAPAAPVRRSGHRPGKLGGEGRLSMGEARRRRSERASKALTRTECEAAICEGIARFQEEYLGWRSEQITAHFVKDLLIVRIAGALTLAERQLGKSSSPAVHDDAAGARRLVHRRSDLRSSLRIRPWPARLPCRRIDHVHAGGRFGPGDVSQICQATNRLTSVEPRHGLVSGGAPKAVGFLSNSKDKDQTMLLNFRAFSAGAVALALFVLSAPAAMAADAEEAMHDGKVVRSASTSLVMTTKDGKEHTHALTAAATLTLDGKACKAEDLKAGTKVRVTMAGTVVTSVEAIDKQAVFANTHDGKVVSATSSKLVMTDKDGKEHSHPIASNATVTLDGKACKFDELKAGMKIRVTTKSERSVAVIIEAIAVNAEFARN